MKKELTETEIAKIQARNQKMQNLQSKTQEIQKQFAQEQAGLKQIEQDILERVDMENPAGIGNWDTTQVDFQNFKGEVEIPEKDGDG